MLVAQEAPDGSENEIDDEESEVKLDFGVVGGGKFAVEDVFEVNGPAVAGVDETGIRLG